MSVKLTYSNAKKIEFNAVPKKFRASVIGSIFKTTAKGFTPIAETTPLLISASVQQINPNVIILTYDQLLDVLSVPDVLDFVLLGKIISGVNISGDSVRITVTEQYYNGDIIFVTYTKGINPIRALVGLKEASDLGNQPVINNVTDLPGTAPVLVSAIVAHLAPTKVVLTYDQALDVGSVPATGDFVLTGKTISLVEVSGVTVTLTVSVTYDWGDIIDIDYTKGVNPIQGDVGGVDADNLVSQSVTNNITYPLALDDGHHWWYDATDLTQITKDGSDLVSAWHSKGVADRPLLQATGTKQPLWVSPGTIRFDGINNFLKTAAFTWDQPEFIYIIVKQITWASNERVFDGISFNVGSLQQYSSSPRLVIRTSTSISARTTDVALDTWVIARCLFNGASSKLIIDSHDPITKNLNADSMGGFTVGANGAGTGIGNIEVKDIVCCDTTDAANEAEIYNWLVTRKP